MKKIIAPVDFSSTSENAAIFAGNLAAFYGADLWLYHAYEFNIPGSGIGYPFISPGEMQEAAEHELNEHKAKILSTLRVKININIKADDSPLTEGLAALCKEINADLVVMGLSGKNALTRLVVGSNTIRTIQQLSYPVLVVPSKATFAPVRRIGFACDYQKIIQTTPLEPIKKIINDFKAQLYVLNIVYKDGRPEGKNTESLYITQALNEFNPIYETIMSDDIISGINWFSEEQKLDWMVLIPRKHNLTEKIFSRSTTKRLIYQTHMPILCLQD
jgi:nucleotide-binding universal stress UspA family protein